MLKTILASIIALLTVHISLGQNKTYTGDYKLGAYYTGSATYSYIDSDDGRIYDGPFSFKSNYNGEKMGFNRPYEIKGTFKDNLREGPWVETFVPYPNDNKIPYIYNFNYAGGLLHGPFTIEIGNFTVKGTAYYNSIVDSLTYWRGDKTDYNVHRCFFNKRGRADGKWTYTAVRNGITTFRKTMTYTEGVPILSVEVSESTGDVRKTQLTSEFLLETMKQHFNPNVNPDQWVVDGTRYSLSFPSYDIEWPRKLEEELVMDFRFTRGIKSTTIYPFVYKIHDQVN